MQKKKKKHFLRKWTVYLPTPSVPLEGRWGRFQTPAFMFSSNKKICMVLKINDKIFLFTSIFL